MAQLALHAMAELATITVAGEEKGVGDLATKAAGDVHELDEADDRGLGQGETFTSDNIPPIGLDDLGFPFYDQPKGTPDRDHRQWLE
jgi:hypothetical protein